MSATAFAKLIRQHTLDPELVKAYAIDFCGTKTLKGSHPCPGRELRRALGRLG